MKLIYTICMWFFVFSRVQACAYKENHSYDKTTFQEIIFAADIFFSWRRGQTSTKTLQILCIFIFIENIHDGVGCCCWHTYELDDYQKIFEYWWKSVNNFGEHILVLYLNMCSVECEYWILGAMNIIEIELNIIYIGEHIESKENIVVFE